MQCNWHWVRFPQAPWTSLWMCLRCRRSWILCRSDPVWCVCRSLRSTEEKNVNTKLKETVHPKITNTSFSSDLFILIVLVCLVCFLFGITERDGSQLVVLKAQKTKYIWKTQQWCLFPETMTWFLEENPQRLLWAVSCKNYFLSISGKKGCIYSQTFMTARDIKICHILLEGDETLASLVS